MGTYVDIHCHILPELDDGAKSIELTEKMLQSSYQNGIRHMIATSHYNPSAYPYSKEDYEQRLRVVQEVAQTLSSDFFVYRGQEIFYDYNTLNHLKRKKVHTLAESDYVLIEFLPYQRFEFIQNAVEVLVSAGYRPILAHAERYDCLIEKPKRADILVKTGAYIQVNGRDLLSDTDKKQKKTILHWIKKGKVHFIATDAHDMGRREPNLEVCAAYLQKKFGGEICHRLLEENPKQVLNNQKISSEKSKKRFLK